MRKVVIAGTAMPPFGIPELANCELFFEAAMGMPLGIRIFALACYAPWQTGDVAK